MTTKKPAAKKPAPKKPAAKKPAAAAAKKPSARAPKKPKGGEIAETTISAGAPDMAEELAERGEVFVAPEAVESIDADVITSAIPESERHDDPPVQMSEEEKELSSIYGDDLSAPATAHAEYTDRQTRDEDRPMTPEINARDERRNRWEERREQRRSRRDRGGSGGGGGGRPAGDGRPAGGNNGQPQQQQAQRTDGNRDNRGDRGDRDNRGDRGDRPQNGDAQQRLALPPPPVQGTVGSSTSAATPPNGYLEHDALARVGTPLGDAAAQVFAQLRNNQPLPVKQLAAMMRKRNFVQSEPDHLWPQLKAELLGDERSYRTLGLRPRIVYRGRDLFAPGPVATSQTADAEAGMAAALSRLAGATHRALSQRIARATPAGFERLIHAYLVAAGYRDIEWVKRVDGISYASVTAPGIERTILISARSGDRPIDRRGIGELRVGVEAKNLVAGILMSAHGLSEDAERELERAGRSIAVVCGDQLVATLINAGVGVVSRTAPLHYVDDQLLDELMQG